MWSEDEYSRKRKSDREDEDDEADIFRKSKKMGRSPVKSPKKLEENIEMMMKMIQTMGEAINDLTKEVKKAREEQKEYREEIKELKRENAKLCNENLKMKKTVTDMDVRIERLENEKRRNNVVLQGLKIDTNDQEELGKMMKNFMEQELNIIVGVVSALKLGERTCLIQLTNQAEKKKIMQNKSKLKNKIGEKIFIEDDLCRKDRDIQRQIRIRASEEKKNGKETKIGYKKLYIGAEEWKWDGKEGKLMKTNKATTQKNQ